MVLSLAIITALLPATVADAQALQSGPNAGDAYEITMIREASQRGSDESSSNSYDKDTLIERVIGIRTDGLELEYDLPADSKDRSSTWQFPARVFKPRSGPLQLANRPELESRLDDWLKGANWTREMCGRWIFTWNAFRIECDPQSAIQSIEAFDLSSANISEGAAYRATNALASGTLTKTPARAGDHLTLTTVMDVDPEAVRHARAESDVAVGEIMRKPVTLDAALRDRAKEAISGTISVTFEMDSAGNVSRRTTVTKIETKKADGSSETQTDTQTLERKRLARS